MSERSFQGKLLGAQFSPNPREICGYHLDSSCSFHSAEETMIFNTHPRDDLLDAIIDRLPAKISMVNRRRVKIIDTLSLFCARAKVSNLMNSLAILPPSSRYILFRTFRSLGASIRGKYYLLWTNSRHFNNSHSILRVSTKLRLI